MKKIRLLVVDDDQRIRATLSSYLRESGYDIITAANCAEAHKYTRRCHAPTSGPTAPPT